MMSSSAIHYLTQDETKRLFGALASKRDQALFRVAYTYGLRASEIGLMHRDDVDLARLKIRIQRLKGSISSEYPLRPTVARALRSYLRSRKDSSPTLFPSKRGLPIARRTLDYLMKRYGALAEIPEPKRHFHVLKHSIATHLLDARTDIMVVKDWLGHKNIQNTFVYVQLTSKTKDEQARRIFANPQIVT